MPLDLAVHPERWGELELREAVRHELKLAVWRCEHNLAVLIELCQAHALVKLDVF